MSIFKKAIFWLLENMNLGRFSKSSFNTPFIFRYPFTYHPVIQFQFITPLTHGHSFPFIGYHFISPSIIALLFGCTPNYIARLIVTVILNAINAMFIAGPWADISKEHFKRFIPRPIQLNSTCTIPLIRYRCWTITSSLYSLPCMIFRRVTLPMKWGATNFLYIVHILLFSDSKIQKAHLETLDLGFFKL